MLARSSFEIERVLILKYEKYKIYILKSHLPFNKFSNILCHRIIYAFCSLHNHIIRQCQQNTLKIVESVSIHLTLCDEHYSLKRF